MDHIARQMTSEAQKTKFLARVETAIAPFIKDRGFDWELHIDETPLYLWTVQGIRPPRGNRRREAVDFRKMDPRPARMIEARRPAGGKSNECDYRRRDPACIGT